MSAMLVWLICTPCVFFPFSYGVTLLAYHLQIVNVNVNVNIVIFLNIIVIYRDSENAVAATQTLVSTLTIFPSLAECKIKFRTPSR